MVYRNRQNKKGKVEHCPTFHLKVISVEFKKLKIQQRKQFTVNISPPIKHLLLA